MARAETIKTVGKSGGGGNGLLPPHNACRVPPPLRTGPSLLPISTSRTRTAAGAPHLHWNQYHLDPLQVMHPQPYTQPESQDGPETHHPLPVSSPTPPPSPLCNRRAEGTRSAASPGGLPGEQPDSDTEENQTSSSRRGPLPDLLPQNEHVHRASQHGGVRREAVQEMELRRVASQLKIIGDEFNATVLRRAHNAPHWRDWRDVCRGLFNFITQTLSTFYRLM